MNRYGVSMARGDVSTEEWLRHAQEEALDLAVYLERLSVISRKAKAGEIVKEKPRRRDPSGVSFCHSPTTDSIVAVGGLGTSIVRMVFSSIS